MGKEKIKSIVGIILIITLFILLSYLSQTHIDFFKRYVGVGIAGMLLFVLVVFLSIILAPLSSIPLFPLGSSLWGWVITGILGTVGWTLGAVVAFMLARKFGVPLVRKVLPIKQIHKFEKKIPTKNLFWTIVFLRMVTPIDGVSYLIGLFSNIRLRSYTLATIIGLIPFTLITAYLGSTPFYYQILFASIALLIFLIGVLIARFRNKKR